MRKPAFCKCENKDADQLRGNREADQRYRKADQRLCFCYMDSTIPLLPKFEISQASSHLLWLYSPVCVGPGQKTRFSHNDAHVYKREKNQNIYDASTDFLDFIDSRPSSCWDPLKGWEGGLVVIFSSPEPKAHR